MLVGPFKDELAKANRAIRMNPDNTNKKIQLAKDRILNALRCGLDVCEIKEPYPEADFFTYIFLSKVLLVELTGLEPVTS